VLIGIDASRALGARLTGTERYARAAISALIALRTQHRFRLYLRRLPANEEATWLSEGAVEQRVLGPARLWTHLGLGRAVLSEPPDALFIPAHVLPFSFAHPSLRRRIRSAVTVHDVGHRRFPTAHPLTQRLYLELSTRFALRFASAVIVDSEATRCDMRNFYGAARARIVVAHPGPPLLPEVSTAEGERLRAHLGLTGNVAYALHIGTLQPRKNLCRLIRAWARCLARDPELASARLVLAGGAGWGREDLRAEVAAAGAEGTVILTGYVSDAEKAALLRGARAYVFPSLHEGFGFPALEAQMTNLPLACSRTSALPEVAGAGALYFDPHDEEEMATALRTVMTDERVRCHLIAAGQRNLTRFSWRACAQTILSQLV